MGLAVLPARLAKEIAMLEDAMINGENLWRIPELTHHAKWAEDILRKNFRAVKVVRPEEFKGRKMYVYKCFLGSSKLNTKEMTILLDIIKYWAEELGIQTDEKYFTG